MNLPTVSVKQKSTVPILVQKLKDRKIKKTAQSLLLTIKELNIYRLEYDVYQSIITVLYGKYLK